MIRTVIFDVDNTVYNFRYANEQASEKLIEYTQAHFGWGKDEFFTRQKAAIADFGRYTGTSGGFRSRVMRYQNMLEAASLQPHPHALNMSNIYREALLENMIPEPGIGEWMQSLKAQGIRIGIGSDATALQQTLKLEKLGLHVYIDFMVTSEETGVEKPDRKFFDRCNEKIHCRPDEVMFIGDSPEKDYFGAKSAGYHAVWYNPSYQSIDGKMQELHHYAEAPDLFVKLSQLSGTGGE